jgi:hypothetical protein
MQRNFSLEFDKGISEAWMDRLDVESRARVMSCSMPVSYGWLLPMLFEDEVESWMTPGQFQVLMRHRLGLAIYAPPLPDAPPQLCRMCQKVEATPRHSLVCLAGGLRTAVHNNLRDLLHRLGSTALWAPRTEVTFPHLDKTLRVDVLFTALKRPLAIDVSVTVVDSVTRGNFSHAATKPGGVADAVALTRKSSKYAATLAAINVDFAPLVFDTFGALNHEGAAMLKKLACAWGRSFEIVPGRAIPLVHHRVSAVLNRGLAQLLIVNG